MPSLLPAHLERARPPGLAARAQLGAQPADAAARRDHRSRSSSCSPRLFFVLDHALGYGGPDDRRDLRGCSACRRIPWRLVGEAVLVVIFLAAGSARSRSRSRSASPPSGSRAATAAGRCRRSRLGAAVLYPFFAPNMFTIPVFGAWPDVATGVYMLVFIMMAVGLNIVVGYAGLLDLGLRRVLRDRRLHGGLVRVAQFSHVTWHLGAVGIVPHLPGIHISIWPLLLLAGLITALFGILIGLPTLRLRGDYLAIVTLGFGEISTTDRAQRRQPLRHRLQPDERPERDHAARLDRLRQHALARRPAASCRRTTCTCCNATRARPPDPVDRRLLLDGDRAAPLHGVLLAAAAVLAARPRLDRDPRGRDRRRRDGHPADADEDVGLRERRVLRRRRRRLLRERSRARRSRATSSSTSRCSSSAWSSSAAWGTSGA